MFIWKLENTSDYRYDVFTEAMVVAEKEEKARLIWPGEEEIVWDAEKGNWMWGPDFAAGFSEWCHPKDVRVTCVGTASTSLAPGAVLMAAYRKG